MENYRTGSHSWFDIKYHFVWVTKYRKSILTGAVGNRVRDLVRDVCRTYEIEMLQGAVSGEHVSTAVAAMKTGAIEFLEKPFDRETLLDRVRKALALDAEWVRAMPGLRSLSTASGDSAHAS